MACNTLPYEIAAARDAHLIGQSSSLIADALDMLADASAYALGAIRLAAVPALKVDYSDHGGPATHQRLPPAPG